MCRVAGKALNEYAEASEAEFSMHSMHDDPKSNSDPYFPAALFKGYGAKRVSFVIKSVLEGKKSRIVVLSHINLLWPGYLIKLFSPKTKVLLVSHGIEVWKPLSPFKKKMLGKVDRILTVSQFTSEKMKSLFDLPEEKTLVLNNCLDPFLTSVPDITRRSEFRNSYGYGHQEIVLMTLSRLSSKEKEKNYDKVLFAMKKLHKTFPELRYLIVGKYDEEEKKRIETLAHALGIEFDITFTGFVPDSMIGDYYHMADVYVMPSEKEGFGISFIEAMYYNKPVIAGNRDGTTDALANGQLGTLVDPKNQEEITAAIQKVISDIDAFIPDRELLMEKFSYPVYRNKWKAILDSLTVN